MTAKAIAIDLIELSNGVQTRAAINEEAVAEYAEVFKAHPGKWPFPPIDLFDDGNGFILAHGFHRIIGATRAERGSVHAFVHKGSRFDALKFAMGTNHDHGVRRTGADKRYCIGLAFAQPELTKMSDRAIADLCGVGDQLVADVRRQLRDSRSSTSENPEKSEEKRVGRDGKARPATQPPREKRTAPEPTAEVNGEAATATITRPARGKEVVNRAKLVDELSRKHVGLMVRGIDAIAKVNGGKGPVHAEANTALNTLIGCLKKMREGVK